MPQQPVNYLSLVVDLGLEYGIMPFLVEDCNVTTSLDQKLDRFKVPVQAGPVKGCVAGGVCEVDERRWFCGACRKQQLYDV